MITVTLLPIPYTERLKKFLYGAVAMNPSDGSSETCKSCFEEPGSMYNWRSYLGGEYHISTGTDGVGRMEWGTAGPANHNHFWQLLSKPNAEGFGLIKDELLNLNVCPRRFTNTHWAGASSQLRAAPRNRKGETVPVRDDAGSYLTEASGAIHLSDSPLETPLGLGQGFGQGPHTNGNYIWGGEPQNAENGTWRDSPGGEVYVPGLEGVWPGTWGGIGLPQPQRPGMAVSPYPGPLWKLSLKDHFGLCSRTTLQMPGKLLGYLNSPTDANGDPRSWGPYTRSLEPKRDGYVTRYYDVAHANSDKRGLNGLASGGTHGSASYMKYFGVSGTTRLGDQCKKVDNLSCNDGGQEDSDKR